MHPMKRGFLVVLLSLGAIGGFTHGFASLAHCGSGGCSSHRDQFEEHIADVCTRAAQRQFDAQAAEEERAWEAHERHHHHGWGGPGWGGRRPRGERPRRRGARRPRRRRSPPRRCRATRRPSDPKRGRPARVRPSSRPFVSPQDLE